MSVWVVVVWSEDVVSELFVAMKQGCLVVRGVGGVQLDHVVWTAVVLWTQIGLIWRGQRGQATVLFNPVQLQ